MKILYSALFFVLLHGIAHAQCDTFALSVIDLQPPSCPNSSDGAITLSVDGAQGVVNYAWSEAGLSGPSVSGLAPGTYSVTATDDGGCEVVTTVALEAALVADAGEELELGCSSGIVTLGGSVFSSVSFAEQGLQNIEFVNDFSAPVPFNGTPGGVFIGPIRDTAEYSSNINGVSMQLGNISGQPGEQIALPIYVSQGFDNILSFQFGVSFDTTMLRLVNMTIPSNTLPNFFVPQADPQVWPQGFFLISWNSPEVITGYSLPDGYLLALLHFTVIGAPASTTGPNITYQWAGPNGLTSNDLYPLVTEPGAYTLRVTDTTQPDCWAEDELEVFLVNDITADAGPDVEADCGAGAVTIGGVGNTEVYFSGDITPIEFSDSNQELIPFNGNSGEVGSNPSPSSFNPNSNDLIAVIGSATANAGDTVCLPVRVHNFINVVGAAFTINYDTSVLEFIEIKDITASIPGLNLDSNFGYPGQQGNTTPSGFITMNWFDLALRPTDLFDGTSLFTLCFKVKDNPPPASTTGPDITHQWTGPNNFTSSELFPQATEPGAYTLRVTDSSRPDCWAEDVVEVNMSADIIADAGPDIIAYCGQDTVRLGSYQEYEVEIVENNLGISILNGTDEPVPYQLVPGKIGVGGTPSPASWDTSFTGLTLVWGTVAGMPGDTVCLPLRGYNFTDIGRLLLEVNFGDSSLIYNGFDDYGLPFLGLGNFSPRSAVSAIADWDAPFSGGETLQDGDTLFSICLVINEGEITSTTGPDITYQWTGSNNFNSSELFPLVTESGTYTLRVTDTSQPDCWAEDEVQVFFEPDSIGVALQDTLTPCTDQPITLSPVISGGAGPYTYQWSNSATTQQDINIISSATPQTYALTVTSADGCTGLAGATVEAENNSPPVISLGPDRDFCPGETFLLSATATGGPSPFSFLWNDGLVTANPNRFVTLTAPTTYWANVVDANGCQSVAPDSIDLIPSPQFTFDLGPDHYLCTPEQVFLSGPPAATSYAWSTGEATQTAIVQPSQTSTYFLTVTNSSGCMAIDTVVIYVGLQDLDINFPICNDNGTPANPDDDTFTFQAAIDGNPGGSWFSNFGVTGSYGQTATFGPFSISAGDVTLTVVDGIDPTCNTSTVVQPPVPCSTPVSCGITAEVTNSFCSDNGTPGNPADDSLHAFVAVEGGPGSGWNSNHPNGSGAYNTVTELVFAVADGVASLTVFDQDDPGCDTTLLIDAPAFCGLACDVQAVVQEIICNDNGTPADTTDDSFILEILVTGGLGNGWVEDSSGLSGDYGAPFTFGPYPADQGHVGLIFVDAGDPSCFDIFDLYTPVPCTIDCQQNPINLSISVIEVSCFGGSDGIIEVIADGGGGGYRYDWDLGISTPVISGLSAGTYSVTVTDIFGCETVEDITISEADLLTLMLNPIPVSCPGANDGGIELFITGGTAPYTYFWTGPGGFVSTESSVSNIPEGIYTVTVTDANGCSITETIEVLAGNPIDLTLEVIQQPACPTSNDGIIMADASGGEGPYEYLWATGFVGPTHTGLAPGIYSVTVVDVNGCTGTGEVELEALLMADAGPDKAITCNEAAVMLDGSASTAGPDIEYEWTGPSGFLSNQLAITASEPGSYILEVTDTSQPACSATDTVLVVADFASPVVNISEIFVSCDSTVLFYPFTPGMTISWTLPDGTTSSEEQLGVAESGNYLFTVTNIANGCSTSGQIEVNINPSACATLKGRLVRDSLPDCSPGLNEPGLSNWLIVIQGGGRTYYAVTQADGSYEQRLPVGDYLVYPLLPNLLWIPCQNNYLVSLQAPGEMAVLDIPVLEAPPCPELSVDFSMPLLRRCWSRSLVINYCNNGTAPAEDATVVVTLDDFFTYQSATAPLLSQDGNQYTFAIGDVAVNQCGSFIVYVEVSCDAIVGQSLCAEAKIFPNGPCFPPSPNWSGASLQVSGACESGEVQFRVENIGAGDMAAPRPCIVIEDGVMLLTTPDNIQLNSGASFTYSLPANGATYRIEVGQEPFHPGFSMPVAVLEGCGENGQGTFSTGFVNQLALDDADPFIDIECREVVGSYDPNDKHGFPRGYGAEHFIYPGTDIEYLVQFQNTGNDTAFLVVIRDSLSEFLDITSVHPGAASHPYTWDIDSNNILVFTFEDILLPDSTTNLAGSQGFVEFKIAQQENLPLGTVIENNAAIYFDVNEPIITNTTFHTLGYGFIELISFTPERIVPELKISVAPNPMGEWALLELEGWTGGEGLFELLDLQGRRLRELRFSGAALRFERQGLPAGLYAFRIVDEQGRWGSGRLVIRQD